MSETQKYRNLVTKYCEGCGVDVGSGGDSVVPWAMGLDLPFSSAVHYAGIDLGPSIQMRGFGDNLPFETGSLNFVYSSHLLEDYLDWTPVLKEWLRVLRPGGYLIIIVPDKELWALAQRRGQPGNRNHKHEAAVGELSTYAKDLNMEVIEDRLTEVDHFDYSILFVAKKL